MPATEQPKSFFVECSGSSCAQRTISIAPKRDRGNTFVVLTMIRIRHPGAFLKTDPGVLRTVAPRTIAAGPTRRRDHLATLGRTPRGPVRQRSHCRRRVKHEFAAANATFVRSRSELYGLPSSGSRSGLATKRIRFAEGRFRAIVVTRKIQDRAAGDCRSEHSSSEPSKKRKSMAGEAKFKS